MDEIELLIAIVVGIFKLIRWILKSVFRLLFGIFGFFKRAQAGQVGATAATRALPQKNVPAPVPASARPVTPGAGPALRQLADRMNELARLAAAEAERCSGEEFNLPFVDSLRWLCDEAKRIAREAPLARDGKVIGEALAGGERIEALFEIFGVLTGQRRNRDVLELLGDADALAEACYRPIVDYCRQRGIKLISDRTATCIGGDKLFILSVDDPSGLAPIVLPEDWATQIGWWPALAHEIGHDFHNSVPNLGGELRRALALPGPVGKLPGAQVRQSDLDAAVGAWMEELFADAFGTMMLGPAYITTMSWSFGSPKEPVRAVAASPTRQGNFEEHPPGHVRVVVACRLLGMMGYGALGDRLEASWRRAHREPGYVYLPTRTGGWATLTDEIILERALQVGGALYETGLPSLAGFPLRSIPGLDFGPREHEAAHGVKNALLAGRKPSLPRNDPRLVIAGAVTAWAEKPAEAARILKIARDLIDAVGVRPRQPVWAPESKAEVTLSPDAEVWRDAIVLDALMRPRGRASARRR
jgi:hypothetical protein